MKFLLLPVLLVLVACESRTLNTSQPFHVDLIGTDEAYCILSTPHYRYALNAPGSTKIERTEDDMKVDCRDNSIQRRRTVTIKPEWDSFYYRYPETVTIDFSLMNSGVRMNGFRAESSVIGTSTPTSQFTQTLNSVLTENSYNEPVQLKNDTMVKKNYTMGRRSYPIPLHDDKTYPETSRPLTPTISSDILDPSVFVYPLQ